MPASHESRLGKIVWHDLHTPDVPAAKRFYADLCGWTFEEESTDDFPWGGGFGVYTLAFSGDEAGTGFVARTDLAFGRWLPFVEVEDVDGAAERAVAAGGSVERAPFDAPGVGRNAVILDPFGARLGLARSSHGFPVPTRQFGVERYYCSSGEAPPGFYEEVCSWVCADDGRSFSLDTDQAPVVASLADDVPDRPAAALWLPSIRTTRKDATAAVSRDPSGALFLSI